MQPCIAFLHQAFYLIQVAEVPDLSVSKKQDSFLRLLEGPPNVAVPARNYVPGPELGGVPLPLEESHFGVYPFLGRHVQKMGKQLGILGRVEVLLQEVHNIFFGTLPAVDDGKGDAFLEKKDRGVGVDVEGVGEVFVCGPVHLGKGEVQRLEGGLLRKLLKDGGELLAEVAGGRVDVDQGVFVLVQFIDEIFFREVGDSCTCL